MIEGRKRICLFSGLFWAITLTTCFLATEIFDLNLDWFIVLISLLLLFLGVFTLFGHIGLYFPFIFMTKKDLTEYNIEKASFFLGTSMVILSCTLLLITVSVYFLVLVITVGIVMECGGIYVCASNKFKADTQPK